MTDRTALETADDWRNDPIKVANCYNTPKYAAILLRRQHAEIERMKADADRVNISGVDALIEQARIAECEACAVVCDDLCRMLPGTKSGSMLHFASKRIRARLAK